MAQKHACVCVSSAQNSFHVGVLLFMVSCLFGRFKFRATNILGQYTDSEYSEKVRTAGTASESSAYDEMSLKAGKCEIALVCITERS